MSCDEVCILKVLNKMRTVHIILLCVKIDELWKNRNSSYFLVLERD